MVLNPSPAEAADAPPLPPARRSPVLPIAAGLIGLLIGLGGGLVGGKYLSSSDAPSDSPSASQTGADDEAEATDPAPASPAGADADDGAESADSASPAGAEGQVEPVTSPRGATPNGGIAVGVGGVAGGEVISGPAAVAIDVYVDYMCPYCKMAEDMLSAPLAELVDAGQVALVIHPVSILDQYSMGAQFSTRAASNAATVATYDPEHFLAFHNVLFANQPAENTEGLTNAEMAALAQSVGVPAEVTDRFDAQEFADWTGAATNRASLDEMTGTPRITFRLADGPPIRWFGVAVENLTQAIANVGAGLPPDGPYPVLPPYVGD